MLETDFKVLCFKKEWRREDKEEDAAAAAAADVDDWERFLWSLRCNFRRSHPDVFRISTGSNFKFHSLSL
jgi:hypothetical protein